MKCAESIFRDACYLLHAGFLLGLFFDLKMEDTFSTKTPVHFQRTTRRYIPEGTTLHSKIVIPLLTKTNTRVKMAKENQDYPEKQAVTMTIFMKTKMYYNNFNKIQYPHWFDF
jgi:hypothetical protein